uniref:CCHC-type domain-containing protein n=1 Tax=Astatotilapia calliptera TaxID=8154 RepID=A0A3P8RCR4_ASTCA
TETGSGDEEEALLFLSFFFSFLGFFAGTAYYSSSSEEGEDSPTLGAQPSSLRCLVTPSMSSPSLGGRYVIMPPYAPLSFASNFSNLWVRLKYIGDGDPPTRDYVAEELILQTSWLNVQDIYSFIALPSKRDFELCFTREAPLHRFLEISLSNASLPKWKDWQVESSVQVEVVTLVVKFWTGRIPDQDIELYLKRYCEILQPPVKPVDNFGFWYGVRKYKVRMRRDEAGHIISIPNSISLGPYNGRIFYPGQSVKCFICQGPDHQARECPTIKCWKCGELGHKAKICQNESECSLCGAKGHTFFKCLKYDTLLTDFSDH